MKRSAARSNDSGQTFTTFFDPRKRKVVGLWRRGTRYSAQLRVDLGKGTSAPLAA